MEVDKVGARGGLIQGGEKSGKLDLGVIGDPIE